MTNVPFGYENQREAKVFLKYPHFQKSRRHFQPHGYGATDGVICPDRGAIPRMSTLYVTRSHAKSGIHKPNHYPDHKNYKEHKKTSANYYWQPPPLGVIMF